MDELIKKFCDSYSLTNKEQSIVFALVSGYAQSSDLAEEFGISENTVRVHIKNINAKLRTNSKAEILSKFVRYLYTSLKGPELDAKDTPYLQSPHGQNHLEI
ncbi:helix-turn-helix transcriptional regulator [Pseudobacteriovorax antillogorgiicola]|uniref:Regulatory protein, luxR family n=1 Tax=Pseudobacteriovorax antillogorgiicola TaxID=1513793 RepID=A0A1Y6BUI6_9BACT|nr:LuxR C-terminal-related transcriptional regulator [Pseudobacteriovorax antillogorgiicola]TCS53088.1 regulatory LuxR family protein [Pseudobacteriovorax antillogorgiicola]SMF26058.1 regulatory protein, luxR family [Pseudobacteriovorax antillogorgiicola]